MDPKAKIINPKKQRKDDIIIINKKVERPIYFPDYSQMEEERIAKERIEQQRQDEIRERNKKNEKIIREQKREKASGIMFAVVFTIGMICLICFITSDPLARTIFIIAAIIVGAVFGDEATKDWRK
jgi:uncharacterized membrane protein